MQARGDGGAVPHPHPDGSELRINVVGPGCWFGEIGPLLGVPRNACARTQTDCVVEQIDVRDFRHGLGAKERGRLGITI
jgi:putative ABC transport system ATP-binding protein